MKLIILSDTHSRHNDIQVPDGDVLIHCGDMCNRGTKSEIIAVAEWMSTFPHRDKIAIAGNHDEVCQNDYRWTKDTFRQAGITYLQDEEIQVWDNIELRFWKFYGSPWTPQFGNWSFMLNRGAAIGQKWANIPMDIDVLITHGPPFGVLDWSVYSHQAVGCEELLKAVRKVQPKVHCFGHIHSGYGTFLDYDLKTKFVNAAILNEQYQIENAPQVVEI